MKVKSITNESIFSQKVKEFP